MFGLLSSETSPYVQVGQFITFPLGTSDGRRTLCNCLRGSPLVSTTYPICTIQTITSLYIRGKKKVPQLRSSGHTRIRGLYNLPFVGKKRFRHSFRIDNGPLRSDLGRPKEGDLGQTSRVTPLELPWRCQTGRNPRRMKVSGD